MLESQFQAALIRELKELFPGCVVLKNDPTYIQGFPDLLILYKNKWAALECKASERSKVRPNQAYYVDVLHDMSFADFISPETKEAVLDDLQQAFLSGRAARISKRQ